MIRILRGFVYVISLCLPGGFMLTPSDWFHRYPTLTLAHCLSRQLIQGHLNGQHKGMPASVDFQVAQPGDIILCHNPYGAYGYWTHAVLYVGHGQVVDSNDFARGTILQDVSHYREYDEVLLLRPDVSTKLREEAARVARAQIGTPYDPFGSLRDTHSLYCSKLIWQDYLKLGVPLCEETAWVLPDQLATSPQLVRIGDWRT